MDDELNLPWKIYLFDKNGKYDKKDVIKIHRVSDMHNPHIREIMRRHHGQKLEIRVCDCLDYCIMHFKDGRKIFPNG